MKVTIHMMYHANFPRVGMTLVLRKIGVIIGFTASVLALGGCGGGGGTTPAGGNSSTYDIDTLGVPKFAKANYIDLSQVNSSTGMPLIYSVSKFRSGAGHDYSDSVESCRSMKHYFTAPSNTPVYSPDDGKITSVVAEQNGTGSQVKIQSATQPAFTFILFHASLTGSLGVGSQVTAGQSIGTVGESDIAVSVATPSNTYRLVSYFDVLTDSAFATYAARGLSRSDLVISKAARDASPMTCTFGQQFTSTDTLRPQAVSLCGSFGQSIQNMCNALIN